MPIFFWQNWLKICAKIDTKHVSHNFWPENLKKSKFFPNFLLKIPNFLHFLQGIFLGTISSVQRNNEEVPSAKQGEEVCIKIENTTGEAPRLYGRHFTHEDPLYSRVYT